MSVIVSGESDEQRQQKGYWYAQKVCHQKIPLQNVNSKVTVDNDRELSGQQECETGCQPMS